MHMLLIADRCLFHILLKKWSVCSFIFKSQTHLLHHSDLPAPQFCLTVMVIIHEFFIWREHPPNLAREDQIYPLVMVMVWLHYWKCMIQYFQSFDSYKKFGHWLHWTSCDSVYFSLAASSSNKTSSSTTQRSSSSSSPPLSVGQSGSHNMQMWWLWERPISL